MSMLAFFPLTLKMKQGLYTMNQYAVFVPTLKYITCNNAMYQSTPIQFLTSSRGPLNSALMTIVLVAYYENMAYANNTQFL